MGWVSILITAFVGAVVPSMSNVCVLFRIRVLFVFLISNVEFRRQTFLLQNGETALMLAVRNGSLDCVRLLLDAGVDKDTKCNVRLGSLPGYSCINMCRLDLVNLCRYTCTHVRLRFCLCLYFLDPSQRLSIDFDICKLVSVYI